MLRLLLTILLMGLSMSRGDSGGVRRGLQRMDSNSTAVSSVGVNLAGNFYYAKEFPFLNRMKSSGGWTAQGADSSAIPLTANGYPTGRPPGTQALYTMVGLDPVGTTADDTYVLTWTGKAAFRIDGGQIISHEANKIVFKYTNSSTFFAPLYIDGLDPTDPVDNMALVRSDQYSLYQSGEIFNPAFTSKMKQMDTLRYMDWSATNANPSQNWSDRTSLNYTTWQSTGKTSVPIEVEVALANETKTNMWLNVPAMATDDYVRQMVSYVHSHLDPSLSLKLEYSNEVWNFSFTQSHYALTEGDKIWGTDANGDGAIDPNDSREHYGPGWVTYYGYRAAQVANIAKQVYGADAGRLHNVLATQTDYKGLENYIVEGVKRAALGDVSQLFDDYAVTTYFGSLIDGHNNADKATVISWAKAGDAGLTAAFAAMSDGTGLTDPNGSLTWLRDILAYQGAKARALGLNLVAYEGGVDFATSFGGFGDDTNAVNDFINKLHADPRMSGIYQQMISDFSAAGGTLFNQYSDVGSGYAALDSIYQSGSPEWDALVAAEAAARAQRAGTGTPVPTTPVTPTPVNTPPITTTPVATTPVDTTPVATIPVVTTPVSTTPVTTIPVVTTPVTTIPVVTNPVDTTPVTIIPVAVTPVATTPVTTPTANTPVIVGSAPTVSTTPTVVAVTPALPSGVTDQASYVLASGETAIAFQGSGRFAATGNELDNVITAGDGGATLLGMAGNDRLIGGAGSDLLDGGSGDDVMIGGAGDDIYVVDSVMDQVIEAAGGGNDTLRTALASYTLPDYVENLVYTGVGDFTGVGNDRGVSITSAGGADQLTGGAGDDWLDGGAGVDRMIGGAGNDTYVVDDLRDQVIEVAGGGTDTVRTALASYVLPGQVENFTYTGTGSVQAMGTAADNVMIGGDGGNRLLGDGGNDTLIGGAGNDVLDGGTGADRMVGGSGDDIYFVDDTGDQVVEGVGGGTDTVYSSISYRLADNVENLQLIGSATEGTGNQLGNRITANATLNSRLSGGDGDDTLIGGAGDDTLVGGAGADVLTGGAGPDRFTFSIGDLSADPAKSDTITDFNRAQGDKIDLTGFDGGRSSAFTFIGTGAFAHHAGDLRVDAGSTNQIVFGDLDGDGIADFSLTVSKGSGTLIATDFVL